MVARKVMFLVFLFNVAMFCECSELGPSLEARGKKKKIALFVYFADLIVKKLFVLKLIYAFVLWCVIHKAGFFLSWFVSYLKEKKEEHHHIIPDHHHEAHGPYGHHQPYGSYSYGSAPYKRSWKG